MELSSSDNSVVTISNLTGVSTSQSLLLAISGDAQGKFCAAANGTAGVQGEAGLGDWIEATSSVQLTLCSGESLSANTDYVFAFDVTNPAVAQPPPMMQIRASGGVAAIDASDMTAVSFSVLGIARGSEPLLVVVPRYQGKQIAQSSPIASAVNTITLTLSLNLELREPYTLTLSGTSGLNYVTGSMQSLVKTSVAPASLQSIFADDNLANGSAIFSILSGVSLPKAATVTLSFTIINPASAQSAPAMTMSISSDDFSVPAPLTLNPELLNLNPEQS